MATARKASKTQSKLMTLLFGEPFTGKSTLAMQVAYFKRPDGKPFRVLYLDAENGSIDDYLEKLEADGVNLDNLYIVYSQSLGEVREYIRKVRTNEDFYELDEDGNETNVVVTDADGNPFRADAIVIDGTTILHLSTKAGLTEFSKKRNKVKAEKEGLIGDAKLVKIAGAGLELKDYNTINFKGQDLILDLMGCGVHCIVTARETDEKTQIKDKDGNSVSVATGRKIADGFKGLDYNVKTVIRTYRNEDGVVCAEFRKDRTETHPDGEIVIDPTLLDYQNVIDRTAKNKNFTVKNNLQDSVGIEQEIYKKEILKEVGSVSVNEVKEETETVNVASDSNNADAIKAQITTILKALKPTEKATAKKKLTDANLPIDYTKVTDVEVLNRILSTLSA